MKKKILLLSDDIRLSSGVANISKSLILNTCNTFDWVQLAVGSPSGNIIDVSESISNITKHKNLYVRLYESSDYGNAETLRNIIIKESPDAIIHITDPHRWGWLYKIENEIRESIPLMYYHVWDNEPYPLFLKQVYDSCDWIGCISKLTHECVKQVCPDHTNYEYIPHGVSEKVFHKLDEDIIIKHRIAMLGKDYKFVLLFNNTNSPRKELLLTIDAFSKFYFSLKDKRERDNVVLLLHTNPINSSGTNINVVLDELYKDVPILISDKLVSESDINLIYNISHATINVAHNEGFGLTTLESVFTDTPVILSDTGGLKDQYNSEWCELVKPKVRQLKGTLQVPYIYSDLCDSADVSKSIDKMYRRYKDIDMTNKTEFITKKGFTDKKMSESIKNAITKTIDTYEPKQEIRFEKII